MAPVDRHVGVLRVVGHQLDPSLVARGDDVAIPFQPRRDRRVDRTEVDGVGLTSLVGRLNVHVADARLGGPHLPGALFQQDPFNARRIQFPLHAVGGDLDAAAVGVVRPDAEPGCRADGQLQRAPRASTRLAAAAGP